MNIPWTTNASLTFIHNNNKNDAFRDNAITDTRMMVLKYN